jgi:hypothetical protein
VRAGLLSDPRVIALLRTTFIPCHCSALNTAECMHDPRDAELLRKIAGKSAGRYQGGERESFVLPDGTMQDVFLSLHGSDQHNGQAHMNGKGRRSDDAVQPFRKFAGKALKTIAVELPADWDAIWDGTAACVAEVLAEVPRGPVPEAGKQALRVWSRNSYRWYDDLHGSELVALPDEVVAGWCQQLTGNGSTARLPAGRFLALGRAMVPRGQVATTLADESISGELVLTAESIDGSTVRGSVTGNFQLEPKVKAEVSRRENAATLFRSRGELRCASARVELEWRPEFARLPREFPPRQALAIEWVATPPDKRP